jgi:hypothetical protein
MLKNAPHGVDEVIHTFGDFTVPGWEEHNIVEVPLPWSLKFDGKIVKHVKFHTLGVDNLLAALRAVQNGGLHSSITELGGTFVIRSIRGFPSHPSTHCYGIAIDLNPSQYPLGSLRRFPDEVVRCFTLYGFFYGGDFKSRKDPQHFQLCTGC